MFIPPQIPDKYFSSWAQYSILLPGGISRENLIIKLKENNIPTMVYYKIPAHLQLGYKKYGYGLGSFPRAEEVSEKILSLPMHPYLSKSNQDKILETLNNLI